MLSAGANSATTTTTIISRKTRAAASSLAACAKTSRICQDQTRVLRVREYRAATL